MLKRPEYISYNSSTVEQYYCNRIKENVVNNVPDHYWGNIPFEQWSRLFDLDDNHLNLPDMTVDELKLILPIIEETLYNRKTQSLMYRGENGRKVYHLSSQKRIPLVLAKMLELNHTLPQYFLRGTLYKQSKSESTDAYRKLHRQSTLELTKLVKKTYEELYEQVGNAILEEYKSTLVQAGVLYGMKLEWLKDFNAEQIMETAVAYQQYQDEWRVKMQIYANEEEDTLIEVDSSVIDLLQVRFFEHICGGKNCLEYGIQIASDDEKDEKQQVDDGFNTITSEEAKQKLAFLLSNAKKAECGYFVTAKELDKIRRLTENIQLSEEENGLKLKSIIESCSCSELNDKFIEDINNRKLSYEIPEVRIKISLKRCGYEGYNLIAYEQSNQDEILLEIASCNEDYRSHLKLKDLWDNHLPARTVIRVKKVGDNKQYICETPLISRIGKKAFSNAFISELILSKSFNELGESAFEKCNCLKRVVFKGDIKEIGFNIFNRCNELREAVLSHTWNYIEKGLFLWCQKLEKVIFPTQLKEIKEHAFRGCGNLKKVVFPESLEVIGEGAFNSCFNLEEIVFSRNLKRIDKNAFACCYQLKKIVLPKSLEVVEQEAFEKCTSLSQIEVQCPNVWFKVGVFKDCVGLEQLDLSSTNVLIFHKLFSGCKNLKTVILPKNTHWIGQYAFENCSSLKNVVFPKGEEGEEKEWYWRQVVRHLGIETEEEDLNIASLSNIDIFYGCVTNKDGQWGTGALIGQCWEWISWDDKIPLQRIENGAFCNCVELEEIQLPESVERLDFEAFKGCVKLKKVSLPSKKQKPLFIDMKVFEGCTSLEEIQIPDNTIFIGEEAFKDCNNLRNLILPEALEKKRKKQQKKQEKKQQKKQQESKPLTYQPFKNLSLMIKKEEE